MNRFRIVASTLIAGVVISAGGLSVRADDTSNANDAIQKKIDQFVAALQSDSSLDSPRRAALLDLIEAQRREARQVSTTIGMALGELHPELNDAISALLDENVDRAVGQLKSLAASNNPYLAAEASYYLARAHVMTDQWELAASQLDKLSGPLAEQCMYSDNVQFLLATAQANLLMRKEAIASFEKFIADFPAAPERMRVGAAQQLAMLQALEDGSLPDVQDRMDFSRRKLAIDESGAPTRREQDNIVAMLDVLIKEAEDKENQGGGGGGGGNQPGGPGGRVPAGGAEKSTAPEGAGSIGSLRRRNMHEDGWDATRDKDREKVLGALKGKLPDRYRALIEQYYKNLQEEER
jgi:tetratricopeptide (TPR) repeat protein